MINNDNRKFEEIRRKADEPPQTPSRPSDRGVVKVKRPHNISSTKQIRSVKPPPPSVGERKPRAKINILSVIKSSLSKAIQFYKFAVSTARAHYVFMLVVAVIFAALDIAAFVFNLDRYHADNSLSFYRVNNWDRAFTALMILVAVDLGVLLAHNRIKSQSNITDSIYHSHRGINYFAAIRTFASDTLTIFSIFILPSIIRFTTALPSATSDVFPLSSLDWTAIVLTGVLFVVAASAIGAIAALAAGDIRLVSNLKHSSSGETTFALSQTGMMFIILFAVAIIVSVRTSASNESVYRLALAAFSSDGIATLLKFFRATDVDISIPTGFYRMAALVKTALFCGLVYLVFTFVVVSIKYISSKFALKQRKLSRFVTALFSASIWFGASCVVIAAHPFLTGIELVGEYETAPAQLISIMGFGLSLSAAWIAVNLNFNKNEFASFLLIFLFPAVIFNSEIALIGVTPSVGALALNASFVSFASLGIVLATLIGKVSHLFCRNGTVKATCSRFGVAIVMFVSLLLAKAGGYGTGSAGEIYTTKINPFAVADAFTAGLVTMNNYAVALFIFAAIAGIVLCVHLFEDNNRTVSKAD